MHFGIIYTFDIPWDTSVKGYLPPQRKLWQQTEGDEQYDLGHLGGHWEKGKHRKLVGVLDKKQFEKFLDETTLYPEDVETMGSLGVPWADPPGLGVAPAVAFTSNDSGGYLSAYVTPLPDVEPKEEVTDERADRYWRLIKLALLSKYGHDGRRCPIAARLDETRPKRP